MGRKKKEITGRIDLCHVRFADFNWEKMGFTLVNPITGKGIKIIVDTPKGSWEHGSLNEKFLEGIYKLCLFKSKFLINEVNQEYLRNQVFSICK